jgi:hypothetical protein
MRNMRRIGEAFLFASIIFLLFILFFESRIQVPVWLKVAGRMHPMFLHFPIVLLIVFFLTFWLPLKEENEDWIKTLGLFAALSAVITAIMGLLLSLEQMQEGKVFEWHKWSGISIALLAFIAYSFFSTFYRKKMVGRPFTLIASAGILATGHWGANLTHGENYLLAPIASEKEKPSVEKAYVYADIIAPILEEKCANCHGASSTKGGLSISDTASLLYGGKTGPLFIPGKVELSLLIQRIHLPMDDKKHMPPKEKAQLTEEEKNLLAAWIKSGATLSEKVINLPPTDSFRILATQYLSPSGFSGNQIAYNFEAADMKKITALSNNYRVIKPLGAESPALSVNFYGQSNYTPESLKELLPLKEQIVDLNLAKMPVKDEDLKAVQQMNNLIRLNLNYTNISSKGLVTLATLKNLQDLALSGTSVQRDALDTLLRSLPLEAVFLWDTKLDSNDVASLRKKYQQTKIETGYQVEKDTTTYTLNPPMVKTAEGVFETSNHLEVKHGVKGVEIRYTLDGSTPDSIKSPVYKGPIFIDSSVTLKLKAYKDGWYSSDVTEKNFIKKGVLIDSIELLSKPDSSFNPRNTIILQDEIFGNPNNFRNNKWFGYTKNEASYLLSFEKPVTVNQVWTAILKNITGYVFPPQKIEVWGGMERNKLKLLSSNVPQMPKYYEAPSVMQIKTVFPATNLKYIKVVLQPIRQLPKWHGGKGKPGWVLASEIIVN